MWPIGDGQLAGKNLNKRTRASDGLNIMRLHRPKGMLEGSTHFSPPDCATLPSPQLRIPPSRFLRRLIGIFAMARNALILP